MIKFIRIIAAFFLLSLSSFSANAQTAEELEIYKGDIARIEKYLNSFQTFVSVFNQKDSQGEVTSGTFYLSRPGKLRWEYAPPTPILIIAKGSLMTYYDKELDQVSHVSLDDNLSGFLTHQNISFSDENIDVRRFDKTDKNISVTIAKREAPDEGELTLVFGNKNVELKQMIILDAIGKETIVSFETVVYDKPLDKKLFILPKFRKPK